MWRELVSEWVSERDFMVSPNFIKKSIKKNDTKTKLIKTGSEAYISVSQASNDLFEWS